MVNNKSQTGKRNIFIHQIDVYATYCLLRVGFGLYGNGDWYQGQYTYNPDFHCKTANLPDPKSESYAHGCPDMAEVCSDGKIQMRIPPSCDFLLCEF